MGSGLLSASSLLSAPPLSETYANVPGSSRAERVARITYGEAFMKRFRTIIDGENHGRNRLMIEFFTSYPRFRGPLNQQLAKTHKPKKQSIAEPEDFILKERPHVDDRADAGEVVAIKRGYVSTLHCVEFEGDLWHLIIKYRGAALHAAFVADAAEAVRVSPSDIMNVSFSQRKCIILCDIYHAKSLDQEQVGCFLDMFSFPRVWKLYQSLQRLIQYRCADGDASAAHLEHLVHDVYAGEPDTPLAIRLQETASPATTTVSKNVHVLPQASLVRPTPSQSGRRRVAVPEIPLIHSQRVLFRGPHWQSVVAQQPKRLREALVRDGCRAAVMASAVSVVRMDATKTGLSVHLALTCPPHVTLADVTECVNDYNFPESWMVYDKQARGLLLTPSPSPESAATVSSAPTRSSATVASESLSASPSPAMNMFSAPRQSSTSVNSHQVHFDGARWADVLSDNAPIWRGAFRRDIAASLQCSPTEIVVEQHHLDDRGLMVTFSIMHASPECQTTDQLRPKLLHAAFTNMWGLYEVETPVAPKRQGYVSRQQVAAVELSDHGQESPIPAALSITSATMKEVTTLNTTDTVYLEGGNWDVVIVRCPEELHEAFASDVSAALELPPEALTAFKPLYAAGMLTSYTVAHPSTLTTRQVRDRIRSHALPRTWELYKEVSMFIASSEYGRQSMDSEGSLETRELIPSKESGPRSAEVQQLLSSALQLFDSVTSERHLVTHDLQEPPREGVQSTELAALHEQPLAWSTSNELDASLLTRSSWCGRTTTPEPSVVSRHLHTLEGDRWDDVIAMRNDELHAAFADDVAYACELPPTSVKNIHADFVDGLVMSYSVVHHPSLSEAAINAAVQASPMTCTWALYDTTGPCLTHRLEMKRTFPGDRWAVVLARIPNRVRSVFCEETSECLNVPIEHVELLDVTTGSLIVDFAVNFHEPRDVDKQRTKVTAFGYPRLMSLLHEPEYKHAPTAREPVLMGRQPWHIEQLPHGGQHLPSHHASLRESAEGPTSAQLARDPTMELSATHSSSQEPSSHQNDTISEAPPRREYGIRQPTQLAAPRNLSFSTSLSTTPTAVSGAFAEAGVQPRLAQHATPSEGLMHSVDSTLDTKEGRRMSAQRTSLGEPQTEFLFSVPVAIIHQSLGSRGPLRRAEEMRKPSATHSVNISQELENVMPSQSTVYPMGYEYDPRVESMSLRAAEEMLPQFSPRSAQCASEGLEYPMLSPSPSASIQKDTLFAEEVGRSVGAQQSIAVVRAAEADVVQRSAVPAASLHASVADLDVARSVHMVSLAEQHVNPSRVDTPTLAVSQTMPELGQLYGDRLNALRTHAGVVPIARAERGRRHPLAQRSGGVASTVLRASFAESGLRPNSAHLNKAHDTVLQSVESTVLGEHETTSLEQAADRRVSFGTPQRELLCTAPVSFIHQSVGGGSALRTAGEMHRPSAMHFLNLSAAMDHEMPSRYRYDPSLDSMSLHAAEEMVSQISPRSAQRASEGLEHPMLSPSPSTSIQKDTLFAEEVGRSVGAQQSIAVVRAAEADVVQRSAVPAASLHASVADLDVARSVHMVSLAEQHVNPSRVDTPTLAVSQTMPELGQLYGDRLNALRTHAGVVPIARAERGRRHPLAQRSGGVTSTVLRASFAESGLRPNSAHLNKAHDTVLQSVESIMRDSMETTQMSSLPERRMSLGAAQHVEVATTAVVPLLPSGKVARRLLATQKRQGRLSHASVSAASTPFRVSFGTHGSLPRSQERAVVQDAPLSSRISMFSSKETDAVEEQPTSRVGLGEPQEAFTCSAPVSIINQSVGSRSALRSAREVRKPSATHSVNISQGLENVMPSQSTVYPMGYEYDPRVESMSLHAAEEMLPQFSPRSAQCASEGLEHPMLSPSPSTSIQKDTLFAEEVGRSVGAQQSIELFRARSVSLPPTMVQPNLGHSVEEVQRGSAPMSVTLRRGDEVLMDSVVAESPSVLQVSFRESGIRPRSVHLNKAHDTVLQSVESTVLGEHETTSLEQAADRRVSFGTPQRELLCTAPVSFIHQSVGGGSALRMAGEMHRPSVMHSLNLSAAMDHEMPSRYRYDPSLDSMSLHAAEEMVSQISPRAAQRASEGLEEPMLSPSPSTSIQKDTLFAEEVGRSVGAQQSIELFRARSVPLPPTMAQPNLGHSMEEVQRGSAPKSLTFRRAEEVPMDSVASTALLMVEEAVEGHSLGSPRSIELAVLRPSALQMQAEDGDQVVHAHMMEFGNSPQPAVAARKKVSLVLQSPTSLQDRETSFSGAPLFRVQAEPVQEDRRVEIEVRQELTGIISQRGPLERSQHAEDAVDGTTQHSTYVARAMENEFRSKSSDYPMGYEYDPRMDRPLRSLGSPRGAALVEHTARPVAQQQREDRYDAVETAMMEASVEEPQTERTVTVARRRVEEIHSLTVSPSPKFSGFAGKPLFRVEEEDDLADRRGAPVEPTIRQEATRVISQRQVFGWSICAGESTGVRSSTTTSISHEDFLPMGYDVDLPFDRADRTRKLLSLSHYSRMRDGDRTGTASRSSFANKFSTMSMHGGAVQDSQADVPRSAVCHVPPENLLKASSSSSVTLNKRSLLGPGVLLSHSSVRDGLKGRSFERDETPELRAIRSVQDSSSSMEVLRYGGGRQMNMSGPRQDDNFLEIGKEPALVPSRGPRTGHSFLRMTGPRSMELTTASGVSLEARVSASASCYPMMYEMDSKFERQKEELVVSDSAVLDSPRTAFAHLLAAIQEEEEMAMQQLRGECPSLATGTPLQSSVASSVVVRAETAVLPTSWEDQIPAFATDHAVFLEGDEWGTVLLRAGDEGIIAAGSRDLSRAIGIEERLIKVEAPQVSSAGLYLHFQVHHGDQLTMEYVDDQVDQGTLSYLWSVYYQYALAPSASMRMMRPFQGGRWARLQQCDPDEVRRVFADETAALLGIPTDHVQVMDMTHDHHIDFAALFGEERQLAQQRVLIATFDYPMLHQLVAGARVETVGPKSSVLTAAQARASVPRFQGFEQSMMSQFSCPAPDIGTRREVWVHQPQWRPPLRFRTIVEPPTFVSEMRAEEKYALEPSVVMQEEHSVQSPMPLERELSHYGWMMHNLREDVMLARKAGILIAQPRGRAPLRFGRLMEPATSVIAMRADSQRSSLSSGIMRGYDALMNDPLVSEFSDCDFLIHNRRSDVLIAKSSGVPIAQPLGRPPLRFRTLMEPATQVMAMRAGSEIASIPSAIMKQYDALMNDPLVHEFSDCNFLIHNLPSDTIVAREAGILITQPLCRPPLRRSSFMEPATSIIAMRAGSQRSSLNSGIMRGYDALMNDPLVSEFSDCDFLIHNRRSDPIVLRRGASTIYQHSWRAQMRFRTLIEPPTSVVALRAESECVSLPSAVIHDYGKLMGDSLVREFSDCDWMVHNQRSDAMLAIKKIQPITQTLRRAPMRFRTLMESATLVAAMHAESEAASLHSACISDYGALMNDSLVHEFSDCEWLIHNVRADLYITQIPVVTIRQKMVQAPVKQSTWTADAVAPFGQRATPKVSCPISVVVVSQKPKRPPFRYHSMRGSEVGPVVAQKERQEERPLSGAEQWVEVAKHEASTRNSSSHSVYFDGPKWKSLLQKRRGEVESAFCRDIAAAVKVPLDNVMVDHAEYADGMLMSYTVLHPDSITPAMISECVSQSPMEDTWALYDGSRRSPPLESHSFRVQLHGSGWGEVLSNHAAELTAAFGEDVESILKVPASSLTDQKLSFRKGRLEIRFAAALPSSTRKSEASKQLEKATFAGTWELYRQLRQDERFMESTNQTQVKSRRGSASGLGRSQRIYHEDDLGIPTAVDALEAMAHESSDDERSGRSHGLLFEGAHWEEIILLHRDALRAAFVEDVAMSLGRPASAVHEVTLELVSGGMMARFMVHAHAKLPPSSVTERIHAYDFPRTWVFFQSCDRLSLPSASPMERTFKGDHWPRILRHHASAALRAFVEDTADCLGLLPTSVQVSRFAPRDNSVTVHFEVDLGHHSDSRSDPRLANTTLQDYPFPKLMTLYDDVKEAILQEGTSLRSSNDYSQPSEEEFLSQSVTVHSVFVQGPWLERANIMSHLDALRRAFGDDIATITELPLENMDWIEPVVFDDGMLLSYVVRHAAAVNTGAIDKLVDRSPLTSTWKLFDCLVGNHDMAPMQHFSSYSSARRESTSRMLATHPDSCCFTMHFDGAAWPALLEQQADEVRRRFEEDATTALAAHTGSDKNSNEAVALSVVPLTNGMFVHYAVPEWLGTSEADLDKKIAHYDFPLTWELFDSFSQEVDPVHSQYSPRLMEVESARKPLRAEQTTLAYDSTHMRKPTKHKDDKRRHDRSTEAHSNDSNNPQHANSIFINSAVLHDEPRFDARESKLVFYSVPEDLRQSPSPMSSGEGIDRRPSWISAKEMRSSESRYHAPTAVIPLLSQTISREQESTLGTSVSPSPANSTSHPYSQKLSSPSYAPDGLFRETWEINNAGGQSSSPTVNGFVVRPSDQLQLLLHRLTDVEEIMRQRYADYKGSLTSPK